MTVVVNTERKGVEISWDPSGGETDPSPPEGFPPYPDNTLPGPGSAGGEHPDNTLPGRGSAGGEHPDNTLPELPPDLIEGLPPETVEKIKNFLLGNLPPFEGGPEYPAPVTVDGDWVQVFAQGQDGDWSNTAVMPNDGFAFLAYPKNFTGSSYVEVRRCADGEVVDTGTITVA